MKYASVGQFLEQVALRNPGQPEFLQAVTEVMESLWPFIEKNPKYADHGLLERLVEPERTVMFRVCWTDDHTRPTYAASMPRCIDRLPLRA